VGDKPDLTLPRMSGLDRVQTTQIRSLALRRCDLIWSQEHNPFRKPNPTPDQKVRGRLIRDHALDRRQRSQYSRSAMRVLRVGAPFTSRPFSRPKREDWNVRRHRSVCGPQDPSTLICRPQASQPFARCCASRMRGRS